MKKIQKQIFILSVVLSLIAPSLLVKASEDAPSSSQGINKKFVISAYYSPLPGQSRYYRGNYEAELRFNGNGTHGADGTAVYPGMLAAPKTYPFGTKIEIPGLGIGTVHDRGGRIIAWSDADRIDVWMGYGEEGLARALAWGVRTVEGKILNNPNIQDTLSFNHISLANISALPAPYVASASSKVVNQTSLSSGNSSNTVKNLQQSLIDLGYLHEEATGYFGEKTKQAVFDFQLSYGLVNDWESPGAGVYGPKTTAALTNAITVKQEEEKRLADIFNRLFLVGMTIGSEGREVERLQSVLNNLGYYNGAISGLFDNATELAVMNFQLAQKVIDNEYDRGAGYFGPKTHEALTQLLAERRIKAENFENKFAHKVYESTNEAAPINIAMDKPKVTVLDNQVKSIIFAQPLKYGSRGEAVAKLQSILSEHGYLSPSLQTGYFGSATKEAVIRYQHKEGIIQSSEEDGAGIVGPKTTMRFIDQI